MDKKVRKYIHSNFVAMDNQLKEYIKTKNNMEESTLMNNINMYQDVIYDKKTYLKTLIKAR